MRLLAFGSQIFLTDLFIARGFFQKSESFLLSQAVLNISGDNSCITLSVKKILEKPHCLTDLNV